MFHSSRAIGGFEMLFNLFFPIAAGYMIAIYYQAIRREQKTQASHIPVRNDRHFITGVTGIGK
jgi:hypothetical protein